MIKDCHIIIPFNARMDDGCDYAIQTIKLLAKQNDVVAVAMAHEEHVITALFRFFKNRTFYSHWHRAKVFTPLVLVPLRRFLFFRKINYSLNVFIFAIFFKITSWKNKLNSRPILWFFEPHYSDVWFKFFGNTRLIYDCVDYWFAFGKQIADQNLFLINKADWIVVNSQALFQKVKLMRTDVKKVPLGFASDEFLSIRQKKSLIVSKNYIHRDFHEQKIFGFVGQIGNRFDFPWLFSLLEAFPKHKFVFIGAIWVWNDLDDNHFASQLDHLRKYPNCVFLPAVSKKQIAEYISQFDFGLIPYDTKQIFNFSCNPLKLYEYWFFGLPVLATKIFELTFYPNVLIASNDSTAVIKWVKSICKNGYKHSKFVQQIALVNSWQMKLEKISELLVSHKHQ